MATYPVGNKQLGELASVAVVANKGDSTAIANSIAAYSVVKSDTPPTPVGVKNKFIGELGTIATVKMDPTANSSVALNSIVMLTVVKLAPPTSISTQSLGSYAVVFDSQPHQIAPPSNKFIGEFTTVAAVSMKYSSSLLLALSLQMLVVVKYHKPRKELITFNVEYAADAEFNIPDLPN